VSAPVPLPTPAGRPGRYLRRQRTVKLGRIPRIVYSEPGAADPTHTYLNGDATTGPVRVQCLDCDKGSVTVVRETTAGPVHACKACGGVVLPVLDENDDPWPFGRAAEVDR